MTKDETCKFRQLEAENQRLKKLVADLSLDNAMSQEGPLAKVVTPGTTSQAQIPLEWCPSCETRSQSVNNEPAACWASRRPRKEEAAPKEKKTNAWSSASVHWHGNDRDLTTGGLLMLGRKGETVNHKRVYRTEGLAVRKKERGKLSVGARQQKPAVSALNQRWSLDFRADQLVSEQGFRVLNVVDDFTWEC